MGSKHTQAPRAAEHKTAQPEQSSANTPTRAAHAHTPQGRGVFRATSPDDISLTRESLPLLQRTLGNRAVGRIIQARLKTGAPIQRRTAGEKEPPERLEEEDDDDNKVVQKKQSSSPSAVKGHTRDTEEEEEEERRKRPKAGGPLQKKSAAGPSPTHALGDAGASDNRGGLPAPLREGLEALSGKDLSGVRVHYNASEPARVNALAYTRGQDIHVGPGQEKHLPHEGWHAVQQMEGRVKTTLKAKGGEPINDDDGLEREADMMGAKALQLARSPASSPTAGRLASTRAASFAREHGRPAAAPGAPIQRTTSNGITVKDMKFTKKDIPADGAETSQASVHYSGRLTAGATLNWSIIGAAHGSTIDPTGKITAGPALPAGKEKEQLKVKAEDSAHPGAHTFGFLNLWEKEYFWAKEDLPKFLALGTLTQDPFAAGLNGAMALAYTPRTRRFDTTVRVNFLFTDSGPAKWNARSKAAFEAGFIRVVQNRWSNQYRFVNVREPKKVWRRLNPVVVRVLVRRDAATPHFTITAHKAAVGAGVVAGTAQFSADHLRAQPAFNPATGAAELAALAGVTPTPINFAAGSSAIPAADLPKLQFMATYLRRIKNPRFNVNITGHHQQVVHPAGATSAQKSAANRQARTLSQRRAEEVYNVLRAGRATTIHRVTKRGVGDTGAAATPDWDKAAIASALPAGWTNVQAVIEHEAGHMLGVDDEYVNARVGAGGETTHYALTTQAFGKQYADLQARVVPDSASLMNGGNDIRPHHYVTMWDGLAQLTSGAAQPRRPFVHADWQFEGE